MDQIAVDRADDGVAAPEFRGKGRLIFDKPLEFGGREVSVDLESGFASDEIFVTLLAESGAKGIAAAALPDDGVVQRAAGFAIEDENGFALVRDAEDGKAGKCFAVASGDVADHGEHIAPDFFGVVFDPTWLRINLAVIAGGFVKHPARGVEEDGLRGGGALVEGED
jgi:hypothetical protein